LKHFSAYHFLKANLTYVITYSTSIAEALESKILWSLASTPWYHQRKNIELSKSANWSSTSSPLLLLPHDMDCESGKPSNHTRWYRGSGACHYSDEEKWWWHWGDAIQASAPKDQNYAGRQGVHTLVVMSETPSIQRHSLSMSPKGLCNFFRLCVVSSCVFSVVAAWSHAWTNYMEPFELRHPGG